MTSDLDNHLTRAANEGPTSERAGESEGRSPADKT
jgi:hypothetical protein